MVLCVSAVFQAHLPLIVAPRILSGGKEGQVVLLVTVNERVPPGGVTILVLEAMVCSGLSKCPTLMRKTRCMIASDNCALRLGPRSHDKRKKEILILVRSVIVVQARGNVFGWQINLSEERRAKNEPW